MVSCLELVKEQFPNLKERVVSLFERDPVFRELCEDYEACTVTLSRKPPSEALQREYQALSLRLEFELLRHLQEVNGEPGLGRGRKEN
jgi:hypothetical protein